MKKKTIKATHIDNGGHGYLSVSKQDFKLLNIPVTEITGCSGHTPNRMYLEEDCDASTFMRYAEKAGIKVEVKSGYNLKFKITHNYKPELFNYNPLPGSIVVLSDGNQYVITEMTKRIIVQSLTTGMKYKISLNNPFEHIKGVVLKEPTLMDVDAEIQKAVNEQNHFYGYCTIYNYYGKAATSRGDNPDQLRAEGKRPYAYVKYGSPYEGGQKKGFVVNYTKEYEEMQNKVVTLADYSTLNS